MAKNFDVVVIGAGIVGLATARAPLVDGVTRYALDASPSLPARR